MFQLFLSQPVGGVHQTALVVEQIWLTIHCICEKFAGSIIEESLETRVVKVPATQSLKKVMLALLEVNHS